MIHDVITEYPIRYYGNYTSNKVNQLQNIGHTSKQQLGILAAPSYQTTSAPVPELYLPLRVVSRQLGAVVVGLLPGLL